MLQIMAPLVHNHVAIKLIRVQIRGAEQSGATVQGVTGAAFTQRAVARRRSVVCASVNGQSGKYLLWAVLQNSVLAFIERTQHGKRGGGTGLRIGVMGPAACRVKIPPGILLPSTAQSTIERVECVILSVISNLQVPCRCALLSRRCQPANLHLLLGWNNEAVLTLVIRHRIR